MLQTLCLALCGLLPHARAEPGALLRLGMDIMNKEVQSAMDESHILEKMAAEAGKKRPGVKPIKGITDMKVKDVQLPVITLNFTPGVGIFQCVSTGMTITGKSFIGKNMEIIVVLNITATNRILQDEETGLPMFKKEGCKVILVSVKTNLPSNMMPNVINKFLDSTLNKVLPGLMCPAIDAVLLYVNRKWANLTAPMPIGQVGTVKYLLASIPTTTANYIQVDFSPVVQQQEGSTIQLAQAGETPEFPEDYVAGSSQLLLSAAFLTAELAALQKSFDLNVRDTRVGKLPPQTTKALAVFIPEVAEAYPKPKPLVTHIRINKPPKVTMKTGESLLHLHGSLEMFAAWRQNKPPVSLFLLEVAVKSSTRGLWELEKSQIYFEEITEDFPEEHFDLKIQYSVHENRLQMTTSLHRLMSLSRESSSIGAFNEKKLTGFITDFLREAYIPAVNDVLQVGLPLPDFLDMNYNLAELDIAENALVMDLKLD